MPIISLHRKTVNIRVANPGSENEEKEEGRKKKKY